MKGTDHPAVYKKQNMKGTDHPAVYQKQNMKGTDQTFIEDTVVFYQEKMFQKNQNNRNC